MPKATFGYKKVLGSTEYPRIVGKRHNDVQSAVTLQGADLDSISLLRGSHSVNRSNLQTTDRPPVCCVPTRRSHGLHNQESAVIPSTPRRSSRINEGTFSLASSSHNPASPGRTGGKATYANRAPVEVAIRPIRTFANGSTSASFSNLK